MKEKGSINLSVNMIIVLIIAIMILGFAFSFISDMLSSAEGELKRGFEGVEIPDVPVSTESPIGIGDNLHMGKGEQKTMGVRVMNTVGADPLTVNAGQINCRDPSSGDPLTSDTTGMSIGSVLPTDIPPGQTKKVKLIFNAGNSATNNAICEIQLYNSANPSQNVSDSFFLKVE